MGSTNDSPVIRLQRLSFVIYGHPDLTTFKRFAQDFGFEEVSSTADETLFAGYGRDPFVYVARATRAGAGKRFVGAGFAAESKDDFEKACAHVGAEKIDTADRHGGGLAVRITDPNGFEVQVCWAQREQPLPPRGISAEAGRKGRPVINGTLDKARKGEEYVDHHCFLVARAEAVDKPAETTVHHSSFEVEDLDTQMMGHQWLLDAGYELVWGIGRYVYGSQVRGVQIETYFAAKSSRRDRSSIIGMTLAHFIIERYADGDVVNNKYTTLKAEAGNMAVWGPPVPVIRGGEKLTA
ncbi:hypothetical protein LTR74_014645 [Friedmanniomyces endolithicus]|nr:hypothetical protein LTR74_014645 [Friedmanniomyces endolithicus]